MGSSEDRHGFDSTQDIPNRGSCHYRGVGSGFRAILKERLCDCGALWHLDYPRKRNLVLVVEAETT
jgi:hypothetical protein